MDGQADSFDRQDDMEVVMNDVDEIPLVERNHNHPIFEFRNRSSEIHEIGFLSRPSGRSLDETESVQLVPDQLIINEVAYFDQLEIKDILL